MGDWQSCRENTEWVDHGKTMKMPLHGVQLTKQALPLFGPLIKLEGWCKERWDAAPIKRKPPAPTSSGYLHLRGSLPVSTSSGYLHLEKSLPAPIPSGYVSVPNPTLEASSSYVYVCIYSRVKEVPQSLWKLFGDRTGSWSICRRNFFRRCGNLEGWQGHLSFVIDFLITIAALFCELLRSWHV